MKNWALIVTGLYLAILAVLTVPTILLAFVPRMELEAFNVYLAWPYWLWLVVMGLSQLALLTVPARRANLRPVNRGPILRTVAACGLMAALMVISGLFSIYAAVFGDYTTPPYATTLVWLIFILGALTWVAWGFVFVRMSRTESPDDLVTRQCRALFKGSVLELLVAIPSHIIVRCRNVCCADILTFIGLAMGLSVMLFAYGPAILVLYVQRWKRLHPSAENE